MMTCGMYDAAGDWMTEIGIPAKSGVSGGVFGVMPGQVGIATFSPRLDRHGTSVRGAKIFQDLSDRLSLHIMDAPEPARSIIRRDRRFVDSEGKMVRICSLQGLIQWSGSENVLRTMDEPGSTTNTFVLDLRRVNEINSVARSMLTEALSRMKDDGIRVVLLDPDDHWSGLLDWVRELVARGFAGGAAIERLVVATDVTEALDACAPRRDVTASVS